MELSNIYELIVEEIERKYPTKVECAKSMGISRQRLNHLLNGLKNGKEISFNRLTKILNFFGYKFEVKRN